MGSPWKNFSIKDILRKFKADVIMLLETKKSSISNSSFRTFWGGRNEEWIYSSSNGSAGGMLIGWKTELFKLEAVAYGAFSIICRTVRLQVGVFLVDFMYIWPPLQIFAKKNFS